MHLILLALLAGQGGGTSEKALTILAGSFGAYRTCSSYQDTGKIYVTDLETPNSKRVLFRSFSTTFKTTGKILYKHSKHNARGKVTDRFVLWSDGGAIKSWWSLNPGTQTHVSPQEAIDYSAEICGRGAFTVQLRLMDVRAERSVDLSDPRLMGEESYGGEPCLKLVAGAQGRHTFWISKKTKLIRKYQTVGDIERKRTLVESVYDFAKRDHSVPDSTFQYKPD